ncbi:MAG: XkdN-like tail assembly chaperone protein [Bacteriophage sp.]|nr:MAG: XkdN-like tail assembly chaperone protein [Bacteriophage sp.]
MINRRENNKMSKFSAFMKANKKVKENEEFAPTASLLGSDGTPVRWEFRHISSKENEELRDANTIEVQVTGKPNLFRPKLITSKYLMAMIVKSTVFPDLYDKELQDSYGVMTPEDLVYAMVDDAGEMQDFQLWMQKFQGFTKSLDEKVDEAKN